MAAGCGDDNTTTAPTHGSGLDITLSTYSALVRAIAPPVYTNASASQALAFSDWTSGDYPLLGKVFGENEPMSLYWNIDRLDMLVENINMVLDSGSGSFGYTGDDGTYHVSASIDTLTAPTAIPTECQPVLGTASVDLDYKVDFAFTEVEGLVNQAGFKVTDTSETFLTYFKAPQTDDSSHPNTQESLVFFAQRDLATGAVDIKGVFLKDYGDQTKAIWVYDFQAAQDSSFTYRMSWYDDDFGGESAVACIIGGGNKTTQFALKFRQFRPATSQDYDPDNSYDQLFGPNYADLGTTLASSWDSITNLDNLFTYEDLPTSLLANPLNAPAVLNPWNN
jgi:hypothetical protein